MASNDAAEPLKIFTAMNSLQSVYEQFMSGSRDGTDTVRVDLIAKARDLIAALETPLESII